MNENSQTSTQRRSNDSPALEADRRFALLVALMAPEKRDRALSRPRRDDGEGQERPSSFDRPTIGEGADEPPRLHWQGVIFLLFAGCAVAAVLFIVAAAFIQL